MHLINSSWDILRAYEEVRHRFPTIGIQPSFPIWLEEFQAINDRYDVFLFDAFGVLNVGDHALPGAILCIKQLQQLGKQTILVSNAASLSAHLLLKKYQGMGFDFDGSNSVFSRETLIHCIDPSISGLVGIMGNEHDDYSDLSFEHVLLKDDFSVYERVSHVAFLCSSNWGQASQEYLSLSLAKHPRPIWVANPDIVAPRERGMSLEPGYFANLLDTQYAQKIRYFGKPYSDIFQLALKKSNHHKSLNKVLMVGDTLHTDVLGAKAMGFDAMLVTGHGASKGLDLQVAFEATGIYPDFVLGHL